jgi:hypothetical protein
MHILFTLLLATLTPADEIEVIRTAVAQHLAQAVPYARGVSAGTAKTRALAIPSRYDASEAFAEAVRDAKKRNEEALALTDPSPWPFGSEAGAECVWEVSRPGFDSSGTVAVVVVRMQREGHDGAIEMVYELRRDTTWKVVEGRGSLRR